MLRKVIRVQIQIILKLICIYCPGPIPEFHYKPGEEFKVTDDMKRAFDEDGFLFVR